NLHRIESEVSARTRCGGTLEQGLSGTLVASANRLSGRVLPGYKSFKAPVSKYPAYRRSRWTGASSGCTMRHVSWPGQWLATRPSLSETLDMLLNQRVHAVIAA